MRVAVPGATGRTGRQVVELALRARHEVVALARGARSLQSRRTWNAGPVTRRTWTSSLRWSRGVTRSCRRSGWDRRGQAWVVLRPPRLIAGPARPYCLMPAGSRSRGRSVSTGALAVALLDSITANDRHGQAWYLS